MEKKTKEVLDNVKTQIVEASRSMDREEREKMYDELHDWSYRQYEAALLEGYEPDPEMQDYEED